MTTILLTPDLYRRAALAVSTEETRYYISGVNVSPHPDGGALLVATNGAVLVAIRDPDGYATGTQAIRIDKATLAPATKKRGFGSMLIVHDGRAGLIERRPFVWFPETKTESGETLPTRAAPEIIATDCVERLLALSPDVLAFQWREVEIHGAFPDWRKVVPKPSTAPAAGVFAANADLITLFGAALTRRTFGKSLRFVSTGEGAPLLVVPNSDNDVDGYGVLMPMRDLRRAPIAPWFVGQSS